jgi:hypothetical protein
MNAPLSLEALFISLKMNCIDLISFYMKDKLGLRKRKKEKRKKEFQIKQELKMFPQDKLINYELTNITITLQDTQYFVLLNGQPW